MADPPDHSIGTRGFTTIPCAVRERPASGVLFRIHAHLTVRADSVRERRALCEASPCSFPRTSQPAAPPIAVLSLPRLPASKKPR